MDIFEQHEQFEIEVLSNLQSSRILDKLVFGGGTMLRLCHELNRYSVDLDFYLKKSHDKNIIASKLKSILENSYELKDYQLKRNTILFEISSTNFPRKLKLEINTNHQYSEIEQTIAWSKYANLQVMVTTISLFKMMELKINALINRKEIRDAFDIEFLIRRGIEIDTSAEIILKIQKVIGRFKPLDYKVKLGSIIFAENRQYYNENGFKFLNQHLNYILSKTSY